MTNDDPSRQDLPRGISPRLMRPDPKPSEFQLSGGIFLVFVVGIALYFVLKMVGIL